MKFKMLDEEGNPETFDIIPIPTTLHLKNQTIEQSPRNITQEQAVIAALVEACKAASQYINLVGVIPVDDLFQKHTDLNEKLQNALALADTLKKGEPE